jgi:subtilase family serine protease
LISEGGDPNGTVLDTVTTNALAVGASQRFIVPFRITPSGAIVDRVVRVIADSDRRIQELSETNNVGQSATFRF